MIADRYFAAQRVMGILHVVGGVLLFMASRVTENGPFYWIIMLYSLAYMPTIALSNSVAFRQMSDPGKQFPVIRVFGTIGWVISGFMIALLGIEQTPGTFYMAAVVSVGLGLFSFFLPDTPPQASTPSTAKSLMGVDAFVLFRDRPYLIFFIAAIFVCIPLSFYFGFANLFLNQAGMENAAGKMVMGQISEALFILAIPLLFNRIGVKKMLLIGMTAWILRYICFAFGNMDTGAWMLYTGIILHGVCYDFFFVTGYMYTEKKSNERIKNAAQGLFTFVTYGLGMFIGTWVSGFVTTYYTVEGVYQWRSIWMIPAYIAVAVLICFIFFFKEKKTIEVAR
jgi:nucleoside transporter